LYYLIDGLAQLSDALSRNSEAIADCLVVIENTTELSFDAFLVETVAQAWKLATSLRKKATKSGKNGSEPTRSNVLLVAYSVDIDPCIPLATEAKCDMWPQEHILACVQFMDLLPLIRDDLLPQFRAQPGMIGNHCPRVTIVKVLQEHLMMLDSNLSDERAKAPATAALALHGRNRVQGVLAQLSFRKMASWFIQFDYQWIKLTGESMRPVNSSLFIFFFFFSFCNA
jgi:hypothetical protein